MLLFFNLKVSAVDFLYQIPLQTDVSDEATAYALQLPQVIYEKSHHVMLHDLRVKNIQGDDVPMRLALSQDDIKQPSLSASTLPIFSLNHTVKTPLRSKQVSTTWQGGVKQFNVETSELVKDYIRSQESVFRDRFLLDASRLNQTPVTALELAWRFKTPGNRVFYVEVKGSHDLSNWQTLLSRHKLIEINTGQRVVLENTIQLNNSTYTYYQLRFLDEPVPEVFEIKALLKSEVVKQPLMKLKVNDFKVLEAEKNAHTITWDTGGYFPVESVELLFDYKNLMADVQLYSRTSKEMSWQRVKSGQLYQLGSGDMRVEKNTLSFRSKHHRYWKLNTQSGISSQWIKGVSISWRPHQLQFLAQGNGPYSLFFGAGDLKTVAADRWYQQLNLELKHNFFSDQIKAGQLKELMPEIKVREIKQKHSIERWLFWGLLVLVLGVLFYMASRLLKEVSKDP